MKKSDEWEKEAIQLGRKELAAGISSHVRTLSESVDLFVELISPPPTLIVLGGVHIAIPLTSLAKTLGYRTIVIDPRRAWGNAVRFPNVDQLIQMWPEEAFRQIEITSSTAVATLTHDPKLDDLGLKAALTSDAFYVGALGSRATQAKRRIRLLEAGLTESQLSRLHAPIGIGISAETPEENALSIMAEIVDAQRQAHKGGN